MRIGVPSLALLLALWCDAGPTREETQPPQLSGVRQRLEAGEPVRIVCFGDSITGAYYHTGGVRAWCDMLGIALERTHPKARVETINAGISGNTTAQGLARIDKDVLAHKPHLVVVMFGMNDVARLPLDDFAANLRTIAMKCQDAGAAVVLCTPNSVYENSARPNAKLAELSERVKLLAKEHSLPVTDCFAKYREWRMTDETDWMLQMSDEIHPNMHGHKRFAELIAETITGRRIELDNVPPLASALHHTIARLEAGKSVHLVAMPPYDALMAATLRERYPKAEIRVTAWPTEGKSVSELSQWAKGIRDLKPDLVVPAVPAAATAADEGSFIRDYEWVLNWSFPFAGSAWDVVPVLPGMDVRLEPAQEMNAALAQHIVLGKDRRFVERVLGDERSAAAILTAWLAEQELTYRAVAYGEHQDLGYYVDKSGERHQIATADDWNVRREHIQDNLQLVMGRLPGKDQRVPLDVRVSEENRDGGLLWRKFTFQSDANDRVSAWLLLPTGAGDTRRPAMLCLHQTTSAGKDEPVGLAGSKNMHYGRELAERGYVVLVPDYPSLGEHAYDFAKHPEYASGTMKAIWDNMRAVDLLAGLPEVDPDRIGVIGHSLGGHNALFTAAFEPRLKVVVTSCGFTSLRKDDLPSWTGPRYMPRIASEFGNDIRKLPFDFPEVLAATAPRPLLACGATRDNDFDVEGVRDCIAAAQPVYRLLGQPDLLQAEYPDSLHDFPPESRQRAYAFLDKHLRGDVPKAGD
jgi:lysophospholipase L1-like esterase/dienelactone hydrolase